MGANKTSPTDAGVAAFLATVADDERRRDCQSLAAIMARITGKPARMWGTSIVGFDSYHYRYESGREGDSAVVGFSPRKGDISVYLSAEDAPAPDLVSRLGRHKLGKACLYIRKLEDIDLGVLEQLISQSVAAVKRRHG